MTILEDEDDYKPIYIRDRGWTDQKAKDFIKEIERLKELWYPDIINAPEVSTREALANLRDSYKVYLRIERENQERHEENERRKQEHLRKIKEENKNLEWPKPSAAERLKFRQPFDYWKDGCLYCSYKPQTTHDYEVHIVTRHPGKPAYPGPADIQKFERERKEKQQKKREEEEEETTSQQEEPKSENEQLEQAQTEAKVKSEVSANVMAHSSSHVQLEPYEPPTGKKALDMWETGFWCNDEMGCCGICQEIGEREPHRKQVRERRFNHRYKSYDKGFLIEVLQVDDDNRADVYHITIGSPDISSVNSGPSPEILAKELRARQAYWKTHSVPRKLEHIRKAAAERKEKLSKLTPEQRQALHEYEAAAIQSSLSRRR